MDCVRRGHGLGPGNLELGLGRRDDAVRSPELEDDPTLPIVGYYPALIILTCIMAWVWVIVAWVGMKYFRHAKISGE
ncbi:hypothetical protein Ct61P_02982 [Colletotrichum tofieldiae]|nr:hypothetical protein Ct61P_02982 [Colletotrichum tofieldiae]